MRVGIVGTGAMGRTHAQAWGHTPAKISGFVSKSADTANQLAAQYNAKRYDSLEAMLAEIDVLDICAPTHLHRDMCLAAAAAGVHVICEKPLARTVTQAKEMIQACEQAGVKLLVAHVVRFFPEYALAQQSVAAGKIGKPAVIRLKRGTSQPYKPDDNWFLDQERSGGILLDLMIHDFDYARWIGGEVSTVFAKTISHEDPTQGVDHGLAILTHKSGAISHVEGSWAYPAPLFKTRIEIAGSDGLIEHDSDATAATQLFLHQKVGAPPPDVPLPSSPLSEDPYTTEIKRFYNHIAHDEAIPVTAVDGLAALQIGLAALESAKSGRPVNLDEVIV